MNNSSELPVRYGAVAIIPRDDGKMLVIRRSKLVLAPHKYCFPGGGIEAGETEELAVMRELREELGIEVQPVRRLWECVTTWRVHLAWWLATMDHAQEIRPDEREVESIHWLTVVEMAARDLLDSNMEFLELVAKGEISLSI